MGGVGARLAAAAICLLIAGAASPAVAAPVQGGFHRIVPVKAPSPVLTDGRRWAAYVVPGDATHVIDDRTGASYTTSTPAGDCGLAAVGHGVLMWRCYEAHGERPLLFDMVRRQALEVSGVDALLAELDRRSRDGPNGPQEPAPYSIGVDHVGQHWVGGTFFIDYGYHAETYGVFALNWRTGELRFDRPASAHMWPDWDRAQLGQALCSPLRRTLDDTYDQRIFKEYDYERPYGVRGELTTLVLEHCGHPSKVLARCGFQTGCTSTFQLGAGMVTWAARRRAFLFLIGRKRRITFSQRGFRERGAEDYGDDLLPQHTRKSVFVSVPIAGTDGRVRWRIYSRRL
jgi:hypothetical protein